MLQRFKLRLGDGTVLLVDHDGLGTWLVDSDAAIQVGKARNWIPLRKFLSRDRAAAARRARSEAAAWASLPPDAPKARRADGLPLVPPPPDETPAPGSPPPREDGLPLVPPPPPREVTPAPREDGLPLVPPPPPRDAVPPPNLTLGEDERSLVLPQPAKDITDHSEELNLGLTTKNLSVEPTTRLPAHSPEVVALRATPLSVDPAAGHSRFETRQEPSLLPKSPLPGVDGSPLGAQAPSFEQAPPDPHLIEAGAFVKITVGEPRVVQVAAEAPAAPSQVGEPPGIQSLAEEPASPEAGPGPVADLPVIPFKPLEDAVPVRSLEPRSAVTVSAHPGNRAAALDAGGSLRDTLLQDGRAAAALGFVASFGAFLSRCLDPINRLERGLPPFPVEKAGEGGADRRVPMAGAAPAQEISPILPLAEEPSFATEDAASASKKSDGYAAIRLKPLDEDERPLWDPRPRLLARARQWVEKPAAWAARLADRDGPGTPAKPETLRAAEPGPREALQAPPAIAELPVLRFATASEPAVATDVYEGDEGEGLVPVVWLWTKRLVLAATLLAGATLGALTFETWSPKAAEIGETTLSEIDRRVRSHHLAGQRQKAVAEVADGLPQLDPETIGLVMAASPTGLLDAAGVFELACDATDRGVPALTASDARELEALQQRLLDALLPAARERLREFDLARARGAVFPLDGKQALLAHARGVRQLPPANQERLRLLLGRAISAGLTRPRQAATGDPATL